MSLQKGKNADAHLQTLCSGAAMTHAAMSEQKNPLQQRRQKMCFVCCQILAIFLSETTKKLACVMRTCRQRTHLPPTHHLRSLCVNIRRYCILCVFNSNVPCLIYVGF